jgi:hypothetical protein
MTVREDVARILQSRGRQEGGTEDAGADINTCGPPYASCRTRSSSWPKRSTATASSPGRLRTRARPAAGVRTVEP